MLFLSLRLCTQSSYLFLGYSGAVKASMPSSTRKKIVRIPPGMFSSEQLTASTSSEVSSSSLSSSAREQSGPRSFVTTSISQDSLQGQDLTSKIRFIYQAIKLFFNNPCVLGDHELHDPVQHDQQADQPGKDISITRISFQRFQDGGDQAGDQGSSGGEGDSLKDYMKYL